MIVDRLRASSSSAILEIGCGTGQLAALIARNSEGVSYVGFDFSPERIEVARSRHIGDVARFEVADAYTTSLVENREWDAVVCTEVLEHLEGDLEILGRIPPGTRVLATVPDFPADGHVRFFRTAEHVVVRYAPFFKRLDVTEIKNRNGSLLYLLDGVRGL